MSSPRVKVNWPASRVCKGCHKPFSKVSIIWLVEKYSAKVTKGISKIFNQQRFAIRWCSNCGERNSALVKSDG